ncbi:MAG: hypothetical protein HY514_02175 [Candidatus Aenigmarchaeota archaeon]|nr:hypothetical protein [Candidatus Aenigmarchaeota archaeon]
MGRYLKLSYSACAGAIAGKAMENFGGARNGKDNCAGRQEMNERRT